MFLQLSEKWQTFLIDDRILQNIVFHVLDSENF
jgi:hypothetical protein